jgi:glycosyltransferase involved in cell wall biosynthesis
VPWSLGLEDGVLFEEDLDDDELADRYRRCTVFVMPSGQEGFGIVFLEAMRFGKPCIGGSVGGTPDVIDDGRTGFLVPFGDVDALESAVKRLVENPELAREMGWAGRRKLNDEFVFDRFVSRVADQLERLLDEG